MRLDDGFSTLITLANAPDIELYEKEVTPPSLSGGGPVDTTTMRNTSLRTQSPKQLQTMGPATAVVSYDPSALPVIRSQINVNQLITVTFPDGSTWAYWGWLDSWEPAAHVEGEQPTATCTFHPSNHNNANPPAEVAPVYTAGSNS